ncbi:hypothetical protein MLD38_033179 [Melastoma candidum]|uniref:Uncharacterized protein n=1 Tax=Melastoma candidum TaxID=119954 RepID=A0ACB9M6D6_9MYRT|nr:hypothetical protein MLD38_033179 [Melastoma candidum]
MASKGPRSKLDHETRARRQKALEAPREPRRPKTHWDHVLEEMAWLSKDFESERKWKLAQAKKVSIRASKGILDQATRGEKKVKEEEQRLRKVAQNISKDVKKFWMKIEKLVLYKHQLELDVKKKKVLDKQLEFLLGQTERYSTMLAENLGDSYRPLQLGASQQPYITHEANQNLRSEPMEVNDETHAEMSNGDKDFCVESEDDMDDDEQTLEEDEALITEEERREELEALQDEVNIPLAELLKRYNAGKGSPESSPGGGKQAAEHTSVSSPSSRGEMGDVSGDMFDKVEQSNENADVDKTGSNCLVVETGRRCIDSNGCLSSPEGHLPGLDLYKAKNALDNVGAADGNHLSTELLEDQEDDEYIIHCGDEKDDEATLSEEERLAKNDDYDPTDEIALLNKDSEIPLEELIARYKKDIVNGALSEEESEYASALSEDIEDDAYSGNDTSENEDFEANDHSSKDSPVDEHKAGSLLESEVRATDNRIADAAAAARSAQPTGNTFSTTTVRTKFPFLLKHPLREYQHIGLDWLVTMYEQRLNGILADEMGLGKTIMTIALLAHLACEKGIWGPHLIVVPTSVMLNWETEFLKWCPAFKILTYFGSAKERRYKRQGWMKPNSFHVCITTYRLVIQDSKIFKRKKWKYLILDEAHLIKNWKSQRWQTLLNFHSKRRILLTGTPLQNDLMELWSLMHFLMPHIFQSHQEFKDWFCNPISGMVEGQENVNREVIDRLHNVLRPFLLRRLKRDVEKQLPMKHEHVIYCRLSRRQRNLYEDFIASSDTQATLASANFFGMISVIMQLRKVCNHPDLFEGRPIISSFDMSGIDTQLSSLVCSMLSRAPFTIDIEGLAFVFTHLDFSMTSWECEEVMAIQTPAALIKDRVLMEEQKEIFHQSNYRKKLVKLNIFEEIQTALWQDRLREAKDRAASVAWWNSLRCRRKPIYSTSMRELVTIRHPVYDLHRQKASCSFHLYSSNLANIVLSPIEWFERRIDLIESFMFVIPPARAPEPVCWCSKTDTPVFLDQSYRESFSQMASPLLSPIRPAVVRRQVYFPDRRLIQFDCGKLQELAVLLRKLKYEGHRALIFTQMTKMLDILEAFINLYGYTYMRLDGSTQPEERQALMQRFNTNPKYFLFILSTRSGGVGINLVGADTVIFYDSDWNPAMDQQAQDRCHRIGQTREVHIYRLISESTIEENILKKANQKRALDDLVIQSGGYNTEFFKKLDPMELFSGHRSLPFQGARKEKSHINELEISPSHADVEAALKYAEDEADYMALKRVEQEEAVENQEFTDEAIGKMEDDELANEEDLKEEEAADHNGLHMAFPKEIQPVPKTISFDEEGALTLASKEDDFDMLDDVKQMAAAAAASGQAATSFENQLRPIDRYAIRFLELWDPIIDKTTMVSELKFDESEWELDRIEKYKEDMEADIDEDEEPLVYESWDAEFATEAYRQHVEALTQQQMIEELELEAKRKEQSLEYENGYDGGEHPKPKSKTKKKTKKAKFKSLKKGKLASDPPVKRELSVESVSLDDDEIECDDTSDMASYDSATPRKRKKDESFIEDTEENPLMKKSKKQQAAPKENGPLELGGQSSSVYPDESSSKFNFMPADYEQMPPSKGRVGGKVSITGLPIKRVLMLKAEKLKKTNIFSKDHVPSPDLWVPREDAVLCAAVHEYGSNWSLVSDVLNWMPTGGCYRGRYRHPVHCCERFRELIQRYVLCSTENPNSEKLVASGKALKVTEDQVKMLLDVIVELPNNELLLQRHFTALLASVWKVTSREYPQKSVLLPRNDFHRNGMILGSVNYVCRHPLLNNVGNVKMVNLNRSREVVAAALHDPHQLSEMVGLPEKQVESSSQTQEEFLEITLELQQQKDEYDPLPSIIKLPVYGPPPLPSMTAEHNQVKSSGDILESRFREASRSCLEGISSCSVSDSSTGHSSQKNQLLGKHKLPPDVIKPIKFKFRKTCSELGESSHLTIDRFFLPTPEASLHNFTHGVDVSCPSSDYVTLEGVSSDFSFVADGGFPSEPESNNMVLHSYVPGLTSDLDDFSSFPEFTDIG